MRIYAGPDIVGDNARHDLATVLGVPAGEFIYAAAIYFGASGTAGGGAVGDATVDASHGVHVPGTNVGSPLKLESGAAGTDPSSGAKFNLADVYVYVASGTTVQWSYAA